MDFILITLAMVALLVLVLVLLARAYPGSGADLVDWKPTRSPEVEAQLEIDDVAQMMEAQNRYRRQRGQADLTDGELDRMVREDEKVRERARIARDDRIERNEARRTRRASAPDE